VAAENMCRYEKGVFKRFNGFAYKVQFIIILALIYLLSGVGSCQEDYDSAIKEHESRNIDLAPKPTPEPPKCVTISLIESFKVDKTKVGPEETVTLFWKINHPDGFDQVQDLVLVEDVDVLEKEAVDPNGPISKRPTRTTTYYLISLCKDPSANDDNIRIGSIAEQTVVVA
jgi:hypothetical protein